MGRVTKISGETKSSGSPIEQDGYWHIQWQYKNGSDEITPYGFKRKEQAESHITTILEEQKILRVLK